MHNLTTDALERELGRFWPIEAQNLPKFTCGDAVRDVMGAENYLIRRPISAVS
jgi:hypothetical protein